MPSLLSERDTRKRGSVVKANRKHPIHDICAIFNEFRPQTVSKRKIKKKYTRKSSTSVLCEKKNIRIRAVNLKRRLAGCKFNI